MKVAVNKCFGGFGISSIALKELAMRNAKCIETYTPKHYYGGDNVKYKGKNDWEKKWNEEFAKYEDIGDGFMAHKYSYNLYKDGLLYSLMDRSECEVRTDKDLIEVIETLGDKADGFCAKLSITEIPDNIQWEINEYDGMEHIAEVHRIW